MTREQERAIRRATYTGLLDDIRRTYARIDEGRGLPAWRPGLAYLQGWIEANVRGLDAASEAER